MRVVRAVTLGVLLLCGCSVPKDDDVILRRFCANTGVDFQDATFRLTDPSACDRGMAVDVVSGTSSPGCVQVSLQDADKRLLASTQLLGPTRVTPDQARGLRILLSEAQGTTFRLLAESFAGNACDGAPSTQTLQFVDVPRGTVRSVRIDVSQSDADGDGHPSIATGGTDCDDANANIHPGATELCDGVDNNCVDGEADAPGMRTWFPDQDGDGYGVAVMACVGPLGLVASQGGDCDDTNASIHPGQSELRCDDRDDNCNGQKDEGLPILSWYRDADGDGYGDVTQGVSGCAPPPNHVALATDCDDTRADIRPDVAETKDFKDNNCNGAMDEGLFPGPRMAATWFSNLAVTPAGTDWGWGSNRYNILGDVPGDKSPARLYESTLKNVATVTTGLLHALALLRDGTLMSWGDNVYGQVGNGDLNPPRTPQRLPGIKDVVAVAAGDGHSLALTRDGTLWAWGNNDSGQLGDGSKTSRNVPAQVPGMPGLIAITAQGYKSLALRSDGTVWLLYDAGTGQVPLRVPGLTGVAAIASTFRYDLALKADGTVWVWNGDGIKTPPRQFAGITTVMALTTGGDHVLALKQDGTVWAWGANSSGQLGDGTSTERAAPVQVTGLTDVASLAAGSYHSLAVKQDGSVWGWGFNDSGLIDDSGMDVLTPKQLAGPGAWSLTSP
ncbi:MopE-related protein [Corallococcus carmarthensis]|uniref:MopE-related protein n=1 Tax=Corallococcus carmarthensis TaxID=2316728 RepID=UPI0011C3462A|nr:MopE-related protein [Corallococcus carmarthensis]